MLCVLWVAVASRSHVCSGMSVTSLLVKCGRRETGTESCQPAPQVCRLGFGISSTVPTFCCRKSKMPRRTAAAAASAVLCRAWRSSWPLCSPAKRGASGRCRRRWQESRAAAARGSDGCVFPGMQDQPAHSECSTPNRQPSSVWSAASPAHASNQVMPGCFALSHIMSIIKAVGTTGTPRAAPA